MSALRSIDFKVFGRVQGVRRILFYTVVLFYSIPDLDFWVPFFLEIMAAQTSVALFYHIKVLIPTFVIDIKLFSGVL